MKKLIEALQIFLSVKDVTYPFHCEHDKLFVCGYELSEFSEDQINKLEEFGFHWDEDEEYFYSFRYGSC